MIFAHAFVCVLCMRMCLDQGWGFRVKVRVRVVCVCVWIRVEVFGLRLGIALTSVSGVNSSCGWRAYWSDHQNI